MRCRAVPPAAGCHGGGGVLPVPPPGHAHQRLGSVLGTAWPSSGGYGEGRRLRGRGAEHLPLCARR